SLDKVREGMVLTLQMFSGVLEKFGIKEIDPQGEKFDPDFHQAMSMQESTELAPNTVITVFQKGYMLNERLIRPAMVVVSKSPSPAE
ncbi:MAG TPA: nucleotide exchange factor GrpE, partial [Chromatiales bacterium]|nr:nucleotide exchange factor GrpE [Chromatiales bacterium]